MESDGGQVGEAHRPADGAASKWAAVGRPRTSKGERLPQPKRHPRTDAPSYGVQDGGHLREQGAELHNVAVLRVAAERGARGAEGALAERGQQLGPGDGGAVELRVGGVERGGG